MLIGGDASRLTNSVYGVANSWLMQNPENFIVNVEDYKEQAEDYELEELHVLPDNFLLELPLIWKNGRAVEVKKNLFSAIFFIPESINGDVEEIVFLGRFYTLDLFSMETRELVNKIAISINELLKVTNRLPSSDDTERYRKNLESAQAMIMGLHFSAHIDWN